MKEIENKVIEYIKEGMHESQKRKFIRGFKNYLKENGCEFTLGCNHCVYEPKSCNENDDANCLKGIFKFIDEYFEIDV